MKEDKNMKMNMKRALIIMTMLAMITANSYAQSLSVVNIEAQTGEETDLVVNLQEGTSMTALQFNLALPEDMTLAESDVTLGAATNGHTISVQTLANGDHLFVLYSMNLNSFKSGELLRIPVKMGSTAAASNGKLYTTRTATADAVSHTCADVSFTAKNYELGDGTGDGVVDISDYIGVANYILDIPQTGFDAEAADVNKDGVIDISDYIGVANIILTGSPTGK